MVRIKGSVRHYKWEGRVTELHVTDGHESTSCYSWKILNICIPRYQFWCILNKVSEHRFSICTLNLVISMVSSQISKSDGLKSNQMKKGLYMCLSPHPPPLMTSMVKAIMITPCGQLEGHCRAAAVLSITYSCVFTYTQPSCYNHVLVASVFYFPA